MICFDLIIVVVGVDIEVKFRLSYCNFFVVLYCGIMERK